MSVLHWFLCVIWLTMMSDSFLKSLWFVCSTNTVLLLYFTNPASPSPFTVQCLIVLLHLTYHLGEKSSVLHSLNLFSQRINSFLCHYLLLKYSWLPVGDSRWLSIICESSHQKMGSVSPPSETGLSLLPFLTNQMWQKWCGVIHRLDLKEICSFSFCVLKVFLLRI